eukprot:4501756-Lingulodinium_polyedra.AAC.1
MRQAARPQPRQVHRHERQPCQLAEAAARLGSSGGLAAAKARAGAAFRRSRAEQPSRCGAPA